MPLAACVMAALVLAPVSAAAEEPDFARQVQADVRGYCDYPAQPARSGLSRVYHGNFRDNLAEVRDAEPEAWALLDDELRQLAEAIIERGREACSS